MARSVSNGARPTAAAGAVVSRLRAGRARVGVDPGFSTLARLLDGAGRKPPAGTGVAAGPRRIRDYQAGLRAPRRRTGPCYLGHAQASRRGGRPHAVSAAPGRLRGSVRGMEQEPALYAESDAVQPAALTPGSQSPGG